MRSTARTLFFKKSTLLPMAGLPATHSTTDYPNCKMHLSQRPAVLRPFSSHAILCIAIAVFAYGAEAMAPVTQDSRENSPVILSYTTDTHSRHEFGIPGRSVQGFYSYVAGDGRWYKVTYQADERGYRARTELLPRPLPAGKPIVNIAPVHWSNSVLEEAPVIQTVATGTPKEEFIDIIPTEEIPQEVTADEGDNVIVSGDGNVLKEQQPWPSVHSINEPAVEIHVPRFTKVYTLKKGSKSDVIRRKNKDGSSQIYRYKLAYLPSYGLWQ